MRARPIQTEESRPDRRATSGPEWSRADAYPDQIALWYVGQSKDIVLTDERKRLNMRAKRFPTLTSEARLTRRSAVFYWIYDYPSLNIGALFGVQIDKALCSS